MSISSMLKHTCSTRRNTAVGTNGRYSLAPLLTNVRCTVFPMSDKQAIDNKYHVGFAWNAYFLDGTDVQIGDEVTWNSKTFIVKGRKPYSQFGSIGYLEVAMETEQANGQ